MLGVVDKQSSQSLKKEGEDKLMIPPPKRGEEDKLMIPSLKRGGEDIQSI